MSETPPVTEQGQREKTFIGVLASRDDPRPNQTLIDVLTELFLRQGGAWLENFHFVFTGGTYDRVFSGDPANKVPALEEKIAKWLHEKSGVTALPAAEAGGITFLSQLICQRKLSILWPFYAPSGNHWIRPENLALMRLCDQWHVKRLMNKGSVSVWAQHEAPFDRNRNLQPWPPTITLHPEDREVAFPVRKVTSLFHKKTEGEVEKWKMTKKPFEDMTIALIAHNEMKDRMVEFALDHEAELARFRRILATGTTGREVAAATSKRISTKMQPCHSGPKGGDIEIATEVLLDRCEVVVFFIDPLSPHPHIDDIRVVFQACMTNDRVIMITNDMHAREFMSRVVRGCSALELPPSVLPIPVEG